MLQTKGIITDTALLAQWKGAIKDELSVLFFDLINQNPDISDDEVHNKLNERFNEIKTGITAEYIAIEQVKKAQDTILKGLDYNINNDEILLGLINSFVEKYLSANAGNVDLAELKKGIINIINQYLEKAGFDKKLPGGDQNIGDEDIDNINNLGFDNNTINDLQIAKLIADQKAVIRAKVDEILKANNVTSSKHDYYSDMTKLVTAHIQDNRYSLSFDELKAEVANFDYETPLVKLINFDKNYDNLEKDSDLYSDIKTEFDETFANYLAENDTYLSVYESIIASAREEYINGNEDVDSYITNQIKLRFPEFYPNGMDSKEDVTTLNSIYKNFEKSAEALDAKESADRVLNAAMMYCEALVEKNPMYNITIKEVFGSVDYKNALESANTNEIKNYLNKLTTEALSTDLTNPLDGISDSYTIRVGEKREITLAREANLDKNTSIETSGSISYLFDTVGINEHKLVIDSSKVGNFSGTVSLVVDGIVIATKTINITIKPAYSSEEILKNTTSFGEVKDSDKLKTFNTGTKDGKSIKDSTFEDLYNQDAIIRLHDGGKYWNDAKSTINNRLTTLGECILNALSKSGLDNELIKKAISNVISNYMKTGSDDNRHWYNKNYEGNQLGDKAAEYLNNNRDKTGHCIFGVHDESGVNAYCWTVRFKDFVDDIIVEYNNLFKGQ